MGYDFIANGEMEKQTRQKEGTTKPTIRRQNQVILEIKEDKTRRKGRIWIGKGDREAIG